MWRVHSSMIIIAAKLGRGIELRRLGKKWNNKGLMTRSFYSPLTLITAAGDHISF